MLEVKITDDGLVCAKCGSTKIIGSTRSFTVWKCRVKQEGGLNIIVFYDPGEVMDTGDETCSCDSCGQDMEIGVSLDYD